MNFSALESLTARIRPVISGFLGRSSSDGPQGTGFLAKQRLGGARVTPSFRGGLDGSGDDVSVVYENLPFDRSSSLLRPRVMEREPVRARKAGQEWWRSDRVLWGGVAVLAVVAALGGGRMAAFYVEGGSRAQEAVSNGASVSPQVGGSPAQAQIAGEQVGAQVNSQPVAAVAQPVAVAPAPASGAGNGLAQGAAAGSGDNVQVATALAQAAPVAASPPATAAQPESSGTVSQPQSVMQVLEGSMPAQSDLSLIGLSRDGDGSSGQGGN